MAQCQFVSSSLDMRGYNTNADRNVGQRTHMQAHTQTHTQTVRKTDSAALSLHISLFGVTITAKPTTTRTNTIWHTFKIASSQNKHIPQTPSPLFSALPLSCSLPSLCLAIALASAVISLFLIIWNNSHTFPALHVFVVFRPTRSRKRENQKIKYKYKWRLIGNCFVFCQRNMSRLEIN